ncbi:sulfotransferase family 2 domain-containing protein [Asticcacaulis sp.]|uniref:sulfotransferase family 2 domain-containing protein n=1 Tax=Asticcacaulis sp. TaxID=1872648 RepID=UPI0026077F9E|nr:sulfotransferase family 2 domain-containing protein [Asticcacaulis sp.]
MPFFRYKDKTILFIHVPKTGGSTIEEWIETFADINLLQNNTVIGENPYGMPEILPCTPQHLMQSEIDKYFTDRFDYTFTVVRNPYKRVESEFKFKQIIHKVLGTVPDQSFDEWVRTIGDQFAHDPWARDNHLRPQHEFFDARARLFRFEEGLLNICRAVSEDIEAPAPDDRLSHVLDGSAHNHEIVWSDEGRAHVKAFYREDFSKFGYDPDVYPL